jgi:hypothetical protein
MERFKEKILPDVIQHKIPCYVLAFFLFDEFKRCVDCLLKKSEYLDIKIIENNSKYTDKKFKPYILDLLGKGLISEYFLFEENISNNAIREIFYNYIDWKNIKSPFIMISDGDLLLEGDWLEEEIDILTKNNEVFCVGMELTLENLPKVEGADKWVPKAKNHLFKNYKIGATGGWALLFRSKDLNDTINHLKKSNSNFIDGTFHNYAQSIGKVWARTKKHKAYHLTWDIDFIPEHEYHEFRNRPFSEKWCHEKSCAYTVYKATERIDNKL